MARPRTELHDLLQSIPGVKKAYFNPPESVKMAYPCIRYKLDDVYTRRADNSVYTMTNRYLVTVIDRDPDSIIFKAVLEIPYCNLDRCYTADNLHHWVLSLYY